MNPIQNTLKSVIDTHSIIRLQRAHSTARRGIAYSRGMPTFCNTFITMLIASITLPLLFYIFYILARTLPLKLASFLNTCDLSLSRVTGYYRGKMIKILPILTMAHVSRNEISLCIIWMIVYLVKVSMHGTIQMKETTAKLNCQWVRQQGLIYLHFFHIPL